MVMGDIFPRPLRHLPVVASTTASSVQPPAIIRPEAGMHKRAAGWERLRGLTLPAVSSKWPASACHAKILPDPVNDREI